MVLFCRHIAVFFVLLRRLKFEVLCLTNSPGHNLPAGPVWMPPAVPAVAAVTDARYEALADRLVREGWGRR